MPTEPPKGRAIEPPTPKMQGWRCPACGHEQSSLTPGVDCESCHAGGGAVHVGQDPKYSGLGERKAAALPTVADRVVDASLRSDLGQAFLAWIRPFRGQYPAEVEALLHAAFVAGATYAAMQTPQVGPPLAGSAESRTIVAALRLFLENILPGAADEVAAGEFLSVEETERLIQRLERTT